MVVRPEIFLPKEEIALQMSDFLKNLDPDAEILPAQVVEIPEGEESNIDVGKWKTWCARWREFLVVAIDANGVQASISLRM